MYYFKEQLSIHPTDYALYQLKIQRGYLERLLSKRDYGIEKVNEVLSGSYDHHHENLLSLGYHGLSQLYRTASYVMNYDQKFEEIPFEIPKNGTPLEQLTKMYDQTLEILAKTKSIEDYQKEIPNPFREGEKSVIWELIIFFTFHCQTHISQLMRIQDLLIEKK